MSGRSDRLHRWKVIEVRKSRFIFGLLPIVMMGSFLASSPARAGGFYTLRVSITTGGAQGDGASFSPSISAGGRFVTFSTYAALVPGDTNGFGDVYVRDRKLHETKRISISSRGIQGHGNCLSSSISAYGRFVAFDSFANTLVPGDTNGVMDVFVRDRELHRTSRVSINTSGHQANGRSAVPLLSADGRYVAFLSDATNLFAGDTNGLTDVFVRDRELHRTERVSIRADGVQANGASFLPSISADGRYVAFASDATDLVAADTNGQTDVFVRDRLEDKTYRVSIGGAGVQGNAPSYSPSVSADGRFVAFDSVADNLVPGDTNSRDDVFVRDRALHQTSLVSITTQGVQGNQGSVSAAISGDGRFVTFRSLATNLVGDDTNGFEDVFVRDRLLDQTSRVSVSTGGTQGDDDSFSSSVSADGRFVAFDSFATNLVPGDTNGALDVFIRGALA
jgi:Tol biopolymer transport system component